MKLLIAIGSFACISLILGAIYFWSGYRSAFEADQACHAEQWKSYGDNSNYGCDHDLETNQWILFELGSNHEAAKVISRFRY